MKILSVQAKKPSAQQEFCGREGDLNRAGVQMLVALWRAKYLTDANASENRSTLVEAVDACCSTIFSIDLQVFTPNGGISGVAVLKESHISTHTQPEFDYAAVDTFVCGTINSQNAATVLKSRFQLDKMDVQNIERGIPT
jgi:S-adenosylmethionine decarboxylase